MKKIFITSGFVVCLLLQNAGGAETDITTCDTPQQSCGTNKYCTQYGYCYPECDAPLTLDYGWTTYADLGYEKRTTWCLYDGADVSQVQYRCIAGYYGSGTTCTICPSGYYCPLGATTPIACPDETFDTNATGGSGMTISGGANYGPTSAQGATSSEDCYVPANSYYRYVDESGTYVWGTDCYFSN